MSRRTRLVATATSSRRARHQVDVIRVEPAVWKCAMRLAHGDGSRILVVSATEVIVRNPKT